MPPALIVRHLSYVYPDGHEALRDVSLCIGDGERVALLGPNGAGKSTLILHLNGILSGSGEILVGDLPVREPYLKPVRARVGMVFQNPDDQLFSPTVFDDVAFGPLYQGLPAAQVRERVSDALQGVGMQGYERRASHHLSTGEKKRIALATVLSMEPSLLVLDEPSAGLDPRARRKLIELLIGLPQTLLVATHDLELARHLLPRSVVLDQGRVVYDGATDRLLSDPAALEQFGLA